MKKKVYKPANGRYRGSCVAEVGCPKLFPEHEELQKDNQAIILKLRTKRLKKAGCSEADVIAFTAARISMIRETCG